MSRAWRVLRRTGRSFYDDQMTHHAAALTYYGLMSLFPAALLGMSLLGLLGEYPRTYNAVIGYLRDVVPASSLGAIDGSLRGALQHKGTAAGALVLSVLVALYGTTGVLEAARRALNVVFEVEGGRSFLRRKAIDIASSAVLLILVLVTLVLMFVGGHFARDLFGFAGLGSTASDLWNLLRWPAAVGVATIVFSWVYYITPDVHHRAFRWITPGAVLGVLAWVAVSFAFSLYISNVANVGAIYGAFTGAILLVGWLWLTNVALLFGAELDAEIEREKEISEGVAPAATLTLPAKGN
jgi:membrane protein